MSGKVYFVGAGPGDPELLTVKAMRVLRSVESATWANTVVRLKGGDPLIFGRVAEEFSALRAAQIEFEVVPGITAAVAAAAQARIPLTERRGASSVLFVTAHKADSSYSIDLPAFTGGQATIAIYMPGGCYQLLASQMLAAGLSSETPCLIVSNASRPAQQMLWTEVGSLAKVSTLEAPALLIVGSVACSPEYPQVANELLRSISEISAGRP